jgi:hypothetical protein
MITLKDSIEIKITPEKIEEWFKGLDKHYLEWHPDHFKFVKVTGGMDEDDIFYFEEYLHGKLHRTRSKITKIEKNKSIEYKNLFPTSIICPKGSFILEPKGESCIFTATVSLRFGWFISKLAKNRLKAVRQHMVEEGQNLKEIIER